MFEGFDLGAEYVPASIDHPTDRGRQLIGEWAVDLLEIKERDQRHASLSPSGVVGRLDRGCDPRARTWTM